MLKQGLFALAMLGAMTLSGCTVKYSPLINSVELSQTDFSNVKSFKKGEGCRTLLFGALPVGGSSSVIRAIERGNIAHVKAVDYRVKNYFIFTQNCVTVYGE